MGDDLTAADIIRDLKAAKESVVDTADVSEYAASIGPTEQLREDIIRFPAHLDHTT